MVDTYLVKPEHRLNPQDWVFHEVYKTDRRFRSGRRLVERRIIHREEIPVMGSARCVYIIRRNFMTGEKYWEPADTPRYCSPACESYWTA